MVDKGQRNANVNGCCHLVMWWPPDRFGNSHQASGCRRRSAFRQAIRRAPNLGLSEARLESCLAWGQRKLHNHYYNGNLSDEELDTAIMVSAVYAMRLHYCAVEQTMPSAKVGAPGFPGDGWRVSICHAGIIWPIPTALSHQNNAAGLPPSDALPTGPT